MARGNNVVVPGAKAGLDKFKYEIANSLGHSDYANIDKGNLTSRENGFVGGTMVKKMVEDFEKSL